MHGIIPMKAILSNRHIGTSDRCPLYNNAPEDILHLIFKCDLAANIWSELGIADYIHEAMEDGRSGSQVLEALLKTDSSLLPGYSSIKVHEVIAISAWYIWWLRRKISHGEQIPPIHKCVISIRAIASNSERSSSPISEMKKVWMKPSANFVKLNVDAAFSLEDQVGASGAIIRDSHGGFLAANSIFIRHVTSAAMAEALAMRNGLLLANTRGFSAVEAESDSSEVIQYCSGNERFWNEATAIYADIVTQAGYIGNVEFKKCGRDMNKVAHEIAWECFSTRLSCNWVDEPPSFLAQALLDDVTIV
jgi:ribonuclease HI